MFECMIELCIWQAKLHESLVMEVDSWQIGWNEKSRNETLDLSIFNAFSKVVWSDLKTSLSTRSKGFSKHVQMLPTVSFVGVSSPIQPTVSSTRARLPLLNEWERRVANAQKPRALLCCCYTKHALGRARRASAVSHHDFHADKMLSKNFQAHPTIGTSFLFFKEPELGWLQKCPSRKLIFVPSLSLPPDGSVSSKRPLENTRPALGRQAGLG